MLVFRNLDLSAFMSVLNWEQRQLFSVPERIPALVSFSSMSIHRVMNDMIDHEACIGPAILQTDRFLQFRVWRAHGSEDLVEFGVFGRVFDLEALGKLRGVEFLAFRLHLYSV